MANYTHKLISFVESLGLRRTNLNSTWFDSPFKQTPLLCQSRVLRYIDPRGLISLMSYKNTCERQRLRDRLCSCAKRPTETCHLQLLYLKALSDVITTSHRQSQWQLLFDAQSFVYPRQKHRQSKCTRPQTVLHIMCLSRSFFVVQIAVPQLQIIILCEMDTNREKGTCLENKRQ